MRGFKFRKLAFLRLLVSLRDNFLNNSVSRKDAKRRKAARPSRAPQSSPYTLHPPCVGGGTIGRLRAPKAPLILLHPPCVGGGTIGRLRNS
jgi:hypothetical protein